MAKTETSKLVDREVSIITNSWGDDEARDFLIKGGVIMTKVTNYNSDDEITHYCITEKQVPPNHKLHMFVKEQEEDDPFKKLKSELEK